MPSRILHDSLLTSPSLEKLSPRAQDAWPRLLLCVDDFGCSEANPRVLLGRGWPLRPDVNEVDVAGWLGEYEAAGMMWGWDDGGRTYCVLTGWFGPHGQRNRGEYDKDKNPRGSRRKTPPPPTRGALAAETPRVTQGTRGDSAAASAVAVAVADPEILPPVRARDPSATSTDHDQHDGIEERLAVAPTAPEATPATAPTTPPAAAAAAPSRPPRGPKQVFEAIWYETTRTPATGNRDALQYAVSRCSNAAGDDYESFVRRHAAAFRQVVDYLGAAAQRGELGYTPPRLTVENFCGYSNGRDKPTDCLPLCVDWLAGKKPPLDKRRAVVAGRGPPAGPAQAIKTAEETERERGQVRPTAAVAPAADVIATLRKAGGLHVGDPSAPDRKETG
jgi:hypothetical protein